MLQWHNNLFKQNEGVSTKYRDIVKNTELWTEDDQNLENQTEEENLDESKILNWKNNSNIKTLTIYTYYIY